MFRQKVLEEMLQQKVLERNEIDIKVQLKIFEKNISFKKKFDKTHPTRTMFNKNFRQIILTLFRHQK